MRLDDMPESDNVEDRRGEGGGFGGGGMGGMPIGGGGLGIGGIVVLGLIGWALGIDPRLLIGGAEILTGGGVAAAADAASQPSGPRRHTDRRDRPLRRARARQHRGAMEGHFPKEGQTYRRAAARACSRA